MTFPADCECPLQMSCQSSWLSRYLSLDQSVGLTNWQSNKSTNISSRHKGYRKYKRWVEFSGFMNPYFPLSCWVKRQRGRAGCRVNQQACFCHTVWILFALQRPQSEVIQSIQKQIIRRQWGFFLGCHFTHSFSSFWCFFLFSLFLRVGWAEPLSARSVSISLFTSSCLVLAIQLSAAASTNSLLSAGECTWPWH